MIKQFEITFGKGTDPWYEKAERWAKKKFNNPFIQHLVLGFIEWLKPVSYTHLTLPTNREV